MTKDFKGQLLKVLFVEDAEEDYQQVLRELGRNFTVEATQVQTEAEYRNALRKGGFDLIVADYLLPSFNAESALQIHRELNEPTPFIVISGVIGEEAAVHLMEGGARDYLSKDNLTRLNAVVCRELRDCELRQNFQANAKGLNESRLNENARAESVRSHLRALEQALSQDFPTTDSKRFAQSLEQIKKSAAEALELLETSKSSKARS